MLWHLGGLAGLGETVCPSPKGSIFLETANKSCTRAFHIQTNPERPSGDRRTVIGEVSFDEYNDEIRQEII